VIKNQKKIMVWVFWWIGICFSFEKVVLGAVPTLVANFNKTTEADYSPYSDGKATTYDRSNVYVYNNIYKLGGGSLVAKGSSGALEYAAENFPMTGAGTIEFWFRPTWSGSTTGQEVLFHAHGSETYFASEDIKIYRKDQQLIFNIFFDTPYHYKTCTADISSWIANRWHHVAAVWSGLDGSGTYEMALYVDGTLCDLESYSGKETLLDRMEHVLIGGNFMGIYTLVSEPDAAHYTANGYIDAFNFYSERKYTGASYTVPTTEVASSSSATWVCDDFEDSVNFSWSGGYGETGGYGIVEQNSTIVEDGTYSLSWSYNFVGFEPGTSCVYSRCSTGKALPGKPESFSIWVYGDGSGDTFSYRFSDQTGRIWQGVAATLDFIGWQKVTGTFDINLYHYSGEDTVDGNFAYPLVFNEFMIDQKNGSSDKGMIYLDDFEIVTKVYRESSMNVAVKTSWGNGIGVGVDPSLHLVMTNLISDARVIKVTWVVKDYEGIDCGQGEQDVSISGNSAVDWPISITLSHLGYYTVNLTYSESGVEIPWEKTDQIYLGSVRDVDSAVDMDSPFGMVGDNVKALKKLGGALVRKDISWAQVEPAEGVWDFDRWDYNINTYQNLGLTLLGILGYNAPWVTVANGEGTDSSLWLNRVSQTVSRYCDRVKYWDIWNEPDLTWGGSDADFGTLAYQAYQTIKSIDSSATVIYPGAADGDFSSLLTWFTIPSLENLGGKFPFDVLAVHPYSCPISPEANNLRERLMTIRSWLDGHGGLGKPIWISECGWPTSTDARGVSEELQAAYLTRLYILGLSAGVEKIIWYQTSSGTDLTYSESQFGVIRWNGYPKPSALAYAQVAYRLNGADFDSEISIGNNKKCYLLSKNDYLICTMWMSNDQTSEVQVNWPADAIIEAFDGTERSADKRRFTLGPLPIYVIVPITESAMLQSAIEHIVCDGNEYISGDANLDGAVDVGDLGILAANYGVSSGAIWVMGDFNADGAVDVGDLGILAANYGTETSSEAAEKSSVKSSVSNSEKETSMSGADTAIDTDETGSASICGIIGIVFNFMIYLYIQSLVTNDPRRK
jgi:hypothetical protein